MSALQWAPLARNDLVSIDRYHRQEHIDVADELTKRIIAAAQFLATTPSTGPISRGRNRKWRVGGTPYIFVYRPMPGHVRIPRVLHSARDNTRW